jgi:protein phosphatase 1G
MLALKKAMSEGNGVPSEGSGIGAEDMDADEDDCVLPEHKIQAGCTAVVGLIRDNKIHVANAGDSRAVLCRGGTAVALSDDHKPAQEREKSRIEAAGGFLADIGGVCRVNGNLNLSRAIGDLKYKGNTELLRHEQIITAHPDVMVESIGPNDEFLLLACDGVWDVMSNQQAVDFVRSRLEPNAVLSKVASELVDACMAADPKQTRGIGCDNMTALIVEFNK